MFVEWGSQGSQDCREYIDMYGDNDQSMYTHYTVVIDKKNPYNLKIVLVHDIGGCPVYIV